MQCAPRGVVIVGHLWESFSGHCIVVNAYILKNQLRANPLAIVRQVPLLCASHTPVLDLGSGNGRNALYLARLGFRVDAIECCRQSIDELEILARAMALPLHGMYHDLGAADPDFRGYGIVLCTLVLHYLTPERAHSLLATARRQAAPDTFHIIGGITAEGDFAQEFAPGERFYPGVGELDRTYLGDGWIIHSAYVEKLYMLQTRPDGTPMVNSVAFLIAQKTGSDLFSENVQRV
jgi:SAM-dependent methyltransferase